MMKTLLLLLLSVSAHAGTPLRSQDLPVQGLVAGSTATTGISNFDVRATSNVPAGNYVLTVSSPTGTIMFDVTQGGHVASHGAAPTISSCGSTPNGSVVGNDWHGTISVGGGVVTACTLTFATPRVNAPDCVISDNSTAVTGDLSSVSATAITASFSASLGGGKIYYNCPGD